MGNATNDRTYLRLLATFPPAELVKTFPAFHAAQLFIIAYTTAYHFNPHHVLPSNNFKTHINIILLPVSKRSSCFKFPYRKWVCDPLLSCMPHAVSISSFFIICEHFCASAHACTPIGKSGTAARRNEKMEMLKMRWQDCRRSAIISAKNACNADAVSTPRVSFTRPTKHT